MQSFYPACALVLALSGMGGGPAARAADLRGQVGFQGGGASQPDPADTVVFFKPDAAVKPAPLPAGVTMTMADKSFVPHVLVVTAGTEVRFPNADPIFHNVFSPSSPNDFDMGLYDTSSGKTKEFDHAGLVHVYCNVHHGMFGYILVLDTPFFGGTRGDGSFDLAGLPAGVGELVVWNPHTRVWRQRVSTVGAAERLAVQLTVMPGGVPEHLNKDGKPYFHHHVPGS